MQINIGDKVRFLNDVGGGSVTKIIDRKSVMVMNEFGFEVPTPTIELVVVEEAKSYEAPKPQNASNKQNEAEKEIIVDTKAIFYPETVEVPETGDDINISFAFVPQGRPGNSDLTVFLINDSNYNVLYSIINKEDNGVTFSNAVGVLEANLKEQIETIALNNINTVPEYEFHFIFYKKDEFNPKKPELVPLKINPVKFYKESSYKENDFFEEDSILMPLIEQNKLADSLKKLTKKEIEQAIHTKEKREPKPVFSSPKANEKEMLEVDLHIHELLDDFRGLSNGEIMEVQMDHFKTALENAKKKGPKRIVFIHGVGNGALKQEIRTELGKMQKSLSFQDASFKEYGYGATLVQIK